MVDKKEYKEWPPYAPGTHVRESDIRDKKITYSWWEPEVQYSWSLGPAMSKFLEGLKEGKIYGIHCKRCKKTFLADNYRQQYCRFCKKAIQRESKRKSIFNKRHSNVDNQLFKTVDT